MPRTVLARSSFVRGQVDATMDARTDTQILTQSARKMKNWRLLTQGGARRRYGTRYRAELAGDSRLFGYEFNDDQAYILAFGEQRIDIFVMPDFRLVQSITTGVPWPMAVSFEISIAATGDTLILTHRDFPIKKLLRTGFETFVLSDFEFEGDDPTTETIRFQPYHRYASLDITLTPSATTGTITLTASAGVFTKDHIGTIVRLDSAAPPAGNYDEVLITAWTSETVVTGDVRTTLNGTSATTDWEEAMFSTAHGYPQATAFHAERLWFAGGRDNPSGIVASKVGAFFNFDVGTAQDDEAINTTVASSTVNDVRHLFSQRNLLILTNEAEIYLPQSATRPVTPNNVTFPIQTPFGAARGVAPAAYDGAVLFSQKTGKSVREMLFDETNGAYLSNSVSFLSSDLIKNPRQIAVQHGSKDTQEEYAYAVMEDGSCAVFHSLRIQNIAGWVLWETTGGLFKSVASVNDIAAFVVRRQINGVVKYYLESMDDPDLLVDSSIELEAPVGQTQTTWTGLDHLENETVSAIINGTGYLGEFTVENGAITVPSASDNIQIGINFIPELEPAYVPGSISGNEIGTVKHNQKRVIFTGVLFDETVSFEVNGMVLHPWEQLDPVGLTPAKKSGRYRFFDVGWSMEQSPKITQSFPVPATILGLELKVEY